MAVDNRVAELESEFKLLKNEIKSVLLNVQEQILNRHLDSFLPVQYPQDTGGHTGGSPPSGGMVGGGMGGGVIGGGGVVGGGGETGTSPSFPKTEAFPLTDESEKQVNLALEEERETSDRPRSSSSSPDDFDRGQRRSRSEYRDYEEYGEYEDEADYTNRADSTNRLEEGKEEIGEETITLVSSPLSLQADKQLDVTTIVELAKWVYNSVKDIGRRSTQEVVEVYDMAGHLTPEVREVLLRFVSLNSSSEPKGEVEMRNLVITMLKLDKILGRGADAAAVLSLFIAKEG